MAAITPMMDSIQVSPEMLALVGKGSLGADPWPANPVALAIDLSGLREPPTFQFFAQPRAKELSADHDLQRLVLIVARDACERLRGSQLGLQSGRAYLLTAELRAIGLAIRDCALPAAAALPYRLAKCIELLCEIIEADRKEILIPVVGDLGCSLSSGDRGRIVAAKTMIDEHWNEPLSLERIARQCGINRSKLSRGFRELYGMTVTDALCERRLEQARRALLITDLPVGLIGYKSGYLNNASFTRAFGRRFGVSPSELRSGVAG